MKKILIIFFTLFTFNSFALDIKTNFTIETFKQAQINGKTVVVYSWNEFCGTCAKQKPILTQAKLDFSNVLFLDFEQTKNKDAAKFLNINYWSTIAVYKNNKQVKKSIGLINKNDIYALIKEGI